MAEETVYYPKTPDYDYEGYVQKYGVPDRSKGQHLTDEFKLPNHITFSKESKYSNEKEEGGVWERDSDGTWHFFASPYNIQNTPPERLVEYFNKYEKDAVLHLPAPMESISTLSSRQKEEYNSPGGSSIRAKYKESLSDIEHLIMSLLNGN